MMTEQEQTQIEAAVYRRLRDHLQKRTDVQNIDLMILADFCRNCMGKWYHAAAEEAGVELDAVEARTAVYGIHYDEWKAAHQLPATAEQMDALKARKQA